MSVKGPLLPLSLDYSNVLSPRTRPSLLAIQVDDISSTSSTDENTAPLRVDSSHEHIAPKPFTSSLGGQLNPDTTVPSSLYPPIPNSIAFLSIPLASTVDISDDADDTGVDLFRDDGESSDDDDEDDDMMARAMAFAKYRAANAGMTAAMVNFNTVADAVDDDVDELSDAAARVITLIKNSPPSSARLVPQSPTNPTPSRALLSDTQREELDMVTAYTERWASNVKLESTYWQGTQPLAYKEPSVPLFLRLTLYNAEQAIKNACEALYIAPPLEIERQRPCVRHGPVIVGLARVAESGTLTLRPIPAGYFPQGKLEDLRAELNKSCGGLKDIKPAVVNIRAGAKRTTGAQTEADTRRARWAHGRSSLRIDITADLLSDGHTA